VRALRGTKFCFLLRYYCIERVRGEMRVTHDERRAQQYARVNGVMPLLCISCAIFI
jgi:hypothetical protein